MSKFDIAKIAADAEKEFVEERAKCAKSQIKYKLKQIASAEKVLANLRSELEVLKRDLSEG